MTDLIALARESGARIVMDLPRDLDTPSKPVDVQMTPDQLATFAARIAKAPEDERAAFEAWYCEDAKRQGVLVRDSIASLRDGDGYGPERVMLNGKWEGWQARASLPPAHQAGGEGELLAEIERLKIRGAAYEEAFGIAYQATYQSHNGHWDSTMRGGLGCPECIGAREARANCDAAIQRGLQALIDRAAPHVPSALAAKGVGQ